jgi:hypothetical protein
MDANPIPHQELTYKIIGCAQYPPLRLDAVPMMTLRLSVQGIR